jgi:hypothetical protein
VRHSAFGIGGIGIWDIGTSAIGIKPSAFGASASASGMGHLSFVIGWHLLQFVIVGQERHSAIGTWGIGALGHRQSFGIGIGYGSLVIGWHLLQFVIVVVWCCCWGFESVGIGIGGIVDTIVVVVSIGIWGFGGIWGDLGIWASSSSSLSASAHRCQHTISNVHSLS